MSRPAARPVAPARATSIRKLTNILRPTRRARAQPSLGIPGPDVDGPTPPSSPSLYSLSSDSDSRPKLAGETHRDNFRPLASPTLSTFSASPSEGHGDSFAYGGPGRKANNPFDYAGFDDDRAELTSSPELPSPLVPTPTSQWSALEFTDPTRIVNKGYRTWPELVIANGEGGFINSDTSSLRVGGRWGERAKLQPLSPSEWLGSNVRARKVSLGVGQLSPIESENRSPLLVSASPSSPSTPRPRPVSEIAYSRSGVDLDTLLHSTRSHTITEVPDLDLLTEHRRRPRSASEPRSFLGTPLEGGRHAGTVPSAPTQYIFKVPDTDSGPMSSPSQPPPQSISPPLPKSPFVNRMPEDVYFTAAGRRESRMYISPDAAPDRAPRGHAYSNSEPILPTESNNDFSPPARYATWKGSKQGEPSGRPFEDSILRETPPSSDGESTPVLRKEESWSGEWNRDDIQDVIRELRSLK
ncbi:hypothetical protein B0H17DRAFT_378063 [Mycena rosella]|uniref:Uncharacterized protein n=1 Tax=Mycena rosella TaxID=1033263 RepID=A0AAD7G3I1_MYCRO|nr:hypothetical protein B0H17DRAFT_378063 [Mycena rosella]